MKKIVFVVVVSALLLTSCTKEVIKEVPVEVIREVCPEPEPPVLVKEWVVAEGEQSSGKDWGDFDFAVCREEVEIPSGPAVILSLFPYSPDTHPFTMWIEAGSECKGYIGGVDLDYWLEIYQEEEDIVLFQVVYAK